jgi:hypothetical protein
VLDVLSDSVFFGHAVAIEVRDSRLKLVARAAGQRTVDLPAGLYEVSAVLEDGRKHSAVVQVREGQQTAVELAPQEETLVPPPAVEAAAEDRPAFRQSRLTRGMATVARAEVGGKSTSEVALVEVHGADLIEESGTLRVFRSAGALTAVPTALFQIGARRLRISLPASPAGNTPSALCAVRFEGSSTGVHAQAWVSPERTVANGLQNMLCSGHMLEAADVADKAVELLRDKYEDPVGATLGALILLKTGRLQRWESWVDNLARSFPWLPDGKVFLARLRFEPKAPPETVLALALEASDQRMLFAESYSLLLDLLRRWGGDQDNEKRRRAVDRLAADAPYTDWESICLSQWLPTKED